MRLSRKVVALALVFLLVLSLPVYAKPGKKMDKDMKNAKKLEKRLQKIDKKIDKIEGKYEEITEKIGDSFDIEIPELDEEKVEEDKDDEDIDEDEIIEEEEIVDENKDEENYEEDEEEFLGNANSFSGKLNALHNRLDAVKNQLDVLENKFGSENEEIQLRYEKIESVQDTILDIIDELKEFTNKVVKEVEKDEDKKDFEPKEDVSKTKEWKVKFNKAVVPETINAQNLLVIDSDFNIVEMTVEYDEEDHIARLIPVNGFAPGERYFLYITTGVKAVEGEYLKKPVRMEFTVSK